MELSLSADQAAILSALESLAKPYAATPTNFRGFALISEALDRALAEGGFLDVAYESDLGPVTAALVVAQLARLPYAAEVSASALVRPLLGADLPRPICLADAEAPHLPIRFLAPGATVVVLHRDRVRVFTASVKDVRKAETLFGYPMAMLVPHADRETTSREVDVSPLAVRTIWRIALAAEIAGLLGAAIDAAVAYVSDRKQFGRPLGKRVQYIFSPSAARSGRRDSVMRRWRRSTRRKPRPASFTTCTSFSAPWALHSSIRCTYGPTG